MILVVALTGWATVAADVVSIDAARDTSVFSEGVLSGGGGQHLFAGRSGPNASGALRRALVKFDVAGALPTGAVVESATLQLTVNNTPLFHFPVEMKWHRLTKDWGEGTAEPGGGTGAPAMPGDATWEANRLGGELWAASGGDYHPQASATTVVGGDGAVSWTSAALAQDVQLFVNQPGENFGWILVGDESALRSARRFASLDGASGGPRLTVEYTVAPQTNLDAWISRYFLPGEVMEAGDDLDGDGLSNLMEYGAGLDPKTMNASSDAFSVTVDPGEPEGSVRCRFVRDPRATDLCYRIEASTDLVGWFPLVESVEGAAATGIGVVSDLPIVEREPFRSVEVDASGGFPAPGASEMFARAFVRFVVVPTPPPGESE